MRLEATVPDIRGTALQELADELGMSRSQLTDEALALFLKAALENRPGPPPGHGRPDQPRAGLRADLADAGGARVGPAAGDARPLRSRREPHEGRRGQSPEARRPPPRCHEASPPVTTAGGPGTAPADRTRRSRCGFVCGKHALYDFLRRHALGNDQNNVGLTYVLEATPAERKQGLPPIVGFYTLSMASVESSDVSWAVAAKLPRYPMPVALIGRLARDQLLETAGWPRRMFLPMETVRQAFSS